MKIFTVRCDPEHDRYVAISSDNGQFSTGTSALEAVGMLTAKMCKEPDREPVFVQSIIHIDLKNER